MRDFTEGGSRLEILASSRINFSESVRQKPDAIDFVVPGLAIGSFGLCVSQGGAGKSMLWLQKSVSIVLGKDRFDLWSEPRQAVHIKPGPVLMVSLEDPRQVVQNRVHAIGQHLSREECSLVSDQFLLLSPQGKGFKLVEATEDGWGSGSWLDALRETIDAWGKSPRLVIFDTLNRCLGGANENSAADMGAVVSTFESICEEFGCATLALHHANRASIKGNSVHSLLSSRGSSALMDNSRFAETITSDDGITVSTPKASYSERPPSVHLVRDQRGVLWGSHHALRDHESSKETPLLQHLQDTEEPEVDPYGDSSEGWE